jgi:hypothetical protein
MMNNHTSTPPDQKDAPTAVETTAVRRHGPILLTEQESAMVAAAGGRGGLGGDFPWPH